MKKLYTLGFLLGFAATVSAQAPFTLDPGNTLTGTLTGYEYKDFTINMHNNLQSDLRIRYERVNVNVPAAWSITICDYQQCFANIPAARTMEPIPAGDHGFIKLTMNADNVPGIGTIQFRVWQVGDSANTVQDVTFELNAVVGVDKPSLNAEITAAPNPAHDVLTLTSQNGNLDAGTVSIYDLTGRVQMQTVVAAGNRANISVADLATGVYMLRYETEKGIFTEKIIKTN